MYDYFSTEGAEGEEGKEAPVETDKATADENVVVENQSTEASTATAAATEAAATDTPKAEPVELVRKIKQAKLLLEVAYGQPQPLTKEQKLASLQKYAHSSTVVRF